MIYNNYHYLGVIRHQPRVVTFGRGIFFKGMRLEFVKYLFIYPCWINHFIGCVSAKYLHSHRVSFTSVLQTYPPPHIKLNTDSLLIRE
jgi:hypothetical protein